MSFIKHPLRPSDITQDDPLYYIYETTQSMAISFDVVNNAGAILVNSSDPNYYDNFNITIDQLEGEINVPYQYVDRLVDNDDGSQVVERRIDVPNSLLGGFAQWRVNYTFIEFPDAPSYGEGDNQGTFVSGDFNTPRIVVPRYIAPPVVIEPDGFFLNPDDIKEALADKIYDTFFKSDVLETIPLGDVKKLQTTIYQGSLATGRPDDNSPLVFFKKDRNTPENKRDFGSDSIQAIVTDISASLSSVDALGDVNITSFLDNVVSFTPCIADQFVGALFNKIVDAIIPPAGAAEVEQTIPNNQRIETPPLPNTPMPNRQMTTLPSLQKNPVTGLTRTESALLSPIEQVIARRT